MNTALLELRLIGKTYTGVVALHDVSLQVGAGEVLGLIGENGAGKSTLMKVLGGVVAPSSGTIVIDGQEHASLSVADAIAKGIAFVHQELNLFENLDVAANVAIGREPLRGGWLRLIDQRRLRERVAPLLRRLGVDFGVDVPVSMLSIAQRQMVEIAKALWLDARLIIMDEPTSSLTLTETARLLQVIADLKASGVSVIYISHRLGEVTACADRVVCLRDGRVAGTLEKGGIDHHAMVRLMIGRDLRALYRPPLAGLGDVYCQLQGLRTLAFAQQTISLDILAGEILGLAGLVGSGRTSLARALFGIEPLLAGTVRIGGNQVSIGSPSEAIALGVFLVPEDRKRSGVVLDLSITENITLPNLRAYRRHGVLDRGAEQQAARVQAKALAIRTPSVATRTGMLSGGNQQKVVLGKWLAMRPRLMILDEPTRGIDVGAKDEIYALMRALSDRGVAILMISSEMEEVIGVSDRIAVMHEGRISGLLERPEFSESNVLALAIGQPIHRNPQTLASQPA